MKFENIKVGDEVLVPFFARSTKVLRIKEKVISVTPTKFETQSFRNFRKSDGRELNDNQNYARKVGERLKSGEVCEDNAEEAKTFALLAELEGKCYCRFKNRYFHNKGSINSEAAEARVEKLKQILNLLE